MTGGDARDGAPQIKARNEKKIKSAEYWELDGIQINDFGAGDYTWEGAAAEDWCSGAGTWGDPYKIENVTFDGKGTSAPLRILNSKTYYIIRNCTLYNSAYASNYPIGGIALYNVSNGKIIENECMFNEQHGISIIDGSNNNTIERNNASYNDRDGIYIRKSINCTVKNNNLTHNDIGVFATVGNDTVIENNVINSNEHYGIGFTSSVKVNALKNNLSNNNIGIYLYNSNNSTIMDNKLSHNKYLGIIMSFSDNNIIKKNNLYNNTDFGMELIGCDYNLIEENTITDNECAIDLDGSNYNTVINNIILRNTRCIVEYDCIGNTITGNTCGNHEKEEESAPSDDLDTLILLGLAIAGGSILIISIGYFVKHDKRR